MMLQPQTVFRSKVTLVDILNITNALSSFRHGARFSILLPSAPFPAFRTFAIHWSKFGACGLRVCVCMFVCFVFFHSSEKRQNLHVLYLWRPIMITLTFKEEQKSAYCLPPGKQDRLKSFLSGSFLPINYGLASALMRIRGVWLACVRVCITGYYHRFHRP